MTISTNNHLERYEIATIPKKTFRLYLIVDLLNNTIVRKYDSMKNAKNYINFIHDQQELDL